MAEHSDISFRTRLSTAYGKLAKSKLVLNHDTSDSALNYFVERLNEILPKSYEEREQAQIIKGLHYNNPNMLFKLLTMDKDGQMKQAMYLLWTNALSIVRHFDIIDVIRLNWDSESSTYSICIKPAEAQDQTPAVPKPTTYKKPYQAKQYQPKKEKRFANKPDDEPPLEKISTPVLESDSKNNSTAWKPASGINWADDI